MRASLPLAGLAVRTARRSFGKPRGLTFGTRNTCLPMMRACLYPTKKKSAPPKLPVIVELRSSYGILHTSYVDTAICSSPSAACLQPRKSSQTRCRPPEFFETIGHQAEQIAPSAGGAGQDGADDNRVVEEIESLCMNCHENVCYPSAPRSHSRSNHGDNTNWLSVHRA